ncbi:MAG TPA: nuclear transport factor 2 family protein [Bryobacteraceae bacterium]|nr:nuclear transport factor 2 family protein [Bryobacteraceae bacterium]
MKPILLLALAAASSLLAADVTGTWTGTLAIPSADGGERPPGPAYLVLKQDGATLTGTAGPNVGEQHPIMNGKAENGHVTFNVAAGETVMQFALTHSGDDLTGEVTRERDGQPQTAKLAVKRQQSKVDQPNSSPEDLLGKLTSLDASLFAAYNNCDIDKFISFFAEDVEFYHDKGGRTTSRNDLVDSLKKNICGKVNRQLVASSMEVHPVPGYGAIQVGAHRFYNPKESAGPDSSAKAPKFLHLWQNRGGDWKITRVFSYAH